MTAEGKIKYVEKQILAAKQGRQNAINCPYCDSQNIEGNPLCCELLARLVAAILVRTGDRARRETMERVLEKVQSN